jgi:LysM repeat protein
MNPRTEINSELLSADARGRKHIPFAVFAVIFIHIVLFIILLIAAGCRSSARAKANRPFPQPAQQDHPAVKYMQAATNTASAQPLAATTEPVMAEPVVEEERPTPPIATSLESRPAAAKPNRDRGMRQAQRRDAEPKLVAQKIITKQPVVRQQAVHVVQSGDTVEKIAKRYGSSIDAIKSANRIKGNLIHPGQKLVVKPDAAGSTAQVKKSNSSKEV